MKYFMVSTAIILGAGFAACVQKNDSTTQTQKVDTVSTKTKSSMKSMISIVEIPVKDLTRATSFYEGILDISIEEAAMGDVTLGLFPNSGNEIFVQLIQGDDYRPSTDGTVVYLDGGIDLQQVVDKIEAKGGKVLVPKTAIGQGMGFFALFTDTEGNKIGLHSPQ